MPPEYVDREAVRARVNGGLETLGRDGVCVSTVREELAESFEAFRGYAEAPDYLGGAYAAVVRTPDQHPGFSETMPEDASTDGDRVMLALGRTHETWGPAGDGREAGESLPATAEREVREETGVACEVVGVHEVVRGVGERERNGRECHFVHVVFDARYVDGSIDVQERELNGACWFHEPPESEHWRVDAGLAEWFETVTDDEVPDA